MFNSKTSEVRLATPIIGVGESWIDHSIPPGEVSSLMFSISVTEAAEVVGSWYTRQPTLGVREGLTWKSRMWR